MHPAWLRRSSVKYSRYSPSSAPCHPGASAASLASISLLRATRRAAVRPSSVGSARASAALPAALSRRPGVLRLAGSCRGKPHRAVRRRRQVARPCGTERSRALRPRRHALRRRRLPRRPLWASLRLVSHVVAHRHRTWLRGHPRARLLERDGAGAAPLAERRGVDVGDAGALHSGDRAHGGRARRTADPLRRDRVHRNAAAAPDASRCFTCRAGRRSTA